MRCHKSRSAFHFSARISSLVLLRSRFSSSLTGFPDEFCFIVFQHRSRSNCSVYHIVAAPINLCSLAQVTRSIICALLCLAKYSLLDLTNFVNISISCLGVFAKECSTFMKMFNDLGFENNYKKFSVLDE